MYPPELLGCPRVSDLPAPDAPDLDRLHDQIGRVVRTMPRAQLLVCALTMIEIGWQELRDAARMQGADSPLWDHADLVYPMIESAREWVAGRCMLRLDVLNDLTADFRAPALVRHSADLLSFVLSDVRDRGGPDARGASVDQFGFVILAAAGQRFAAPEAIARWWARCEQRLAFAHASTAVLQEPGGSYPSPLDDLRLCGPCEEDWRRMRGDKHVRVCGRCEQPVYNLAEMSRDDALAILRTTAGRLCARAFVREDGTLTLDADCAGRRFEPVFPKAVGMVMPTSRLTEPVMATVERLSPRDAENAGVER